MASDPSFPKVASEFIFDLHDCCRRSQKPDEMRHLYSVTYPDLSSKYFGQGTSGWPASKSSVIVDDCDNDPLFLSLYSELAYRHLFTLKHSRSTLKDKIDSWHVYRSLFDKVLEVDPDSRFGSRGNAISILPEWAFDIINEFVYQFQDFSQVRTSLASKAGLAASSSSSSSPPPDGGDARAAAPALTPEQLEDLALLSSNRDAWSVDTVLYYLRNLIKVSKLVDEPSGLGSPGQIHYALGYFASLGLSRLECLLGDYHASVSALSFVDCFSTTELFSPILPARVSLLYHVGVSLVALRRYKDAVRVLTSMSLHLTRSLKNSSLRNSNKSNAAAGGYEAFSKTNDKMQALLAVLQHAVPSLKPGGPHQHDMLTPILAEKFGHKLARIDAGEDTYDDLVAYACPKFVSPVVPSYDCAEAAASGVNMSTSFTKRQVSLIGLELSSYGRLPSLRSYLKLYSSVAVSKLAAFSDATDDDIVQRLMAMKTKGLQVEHGRGRGSKAAGPTTAGALVSAAADEDAQEGRTPVDSKDSARPDVTGSANCVGPMSGALGMVVSDVHYFVNADFVVHVSENEREKHDDKYFARQITVLGDIEKEVNCIYLDF